MLASQGRTDLSATESAAAILRPSLFGVRAEEQAAVGKPRRQTLLANAALLTARHGVGSHVVPPTTEWAMPTGVRYFASLVRPASKICLILSARMRRPMPRFTAPPNPATWSVKT